MQIFISGDFNLPNFQTQVNQNSGDDNTNSLVEFMHRHLLTQCVRQNTRKQNLLDLFLTDIPEFITHIDVSDTDMSDHRLIKIFTSYFQDLNLYSPSQNIYTNDSLDFSQIDINSTDFQKVNCALSQIDWEDMIVNNSVQNFPNVFHHTIFSVLSSPPF